MEKKEDNVEIRITSGPSTKLRTWNQFSKTTYKSLVSMLQYLFRNCFLFMRGGATAKQLSKNTIQNMNI